jgi:hypothetical protein
MPSCYRSGDQRREFGSMVLAPMNSTPKVRLNTVDTEISVMSSAQRKS